MDQNDDNRDHAVVRGVVNQAFDTPPSVSADAEKRHSLEDRGGGGAAVHAQGSTHSHAQAGSSGPEGSGGETSNVVVLSRIVTDLDVDDDVGTHRVTKTVARADEDGGGGASVSDVSFVLMPTRYYARLHHDNQCTTTHTYAPTHPHARARAHTHSLARSLSHTPHTHTPSLTHTTG